MNRIELEMKKQLLKETYIRSVALNKVDEYGNVEIDIDGLTFGYKVGRNDWLYLTRLPVAWSFEGNGKISFPLEFDVLDSCFSFYATEVDLGNIKYIINTRDFSAEYYDNDYMLMRGLLYPKILRGNKLLLSLILNADFTPFLGSYGELCFESSIRLHNIWMDLLMARNSRKQKTVFPNLKFVDKRLIAYKKLSPEYIEKKNSLKPGDIGYEELILRKEQQIKRERQCIIEYAAYRIFPSDKGNGTVYKLGFNLFNWQIIYDKKRDLLVVDKSASVCGKYPAWADAITDDFWNFRSWKKVELLTDEMKAI